MPSSMWWGSAIGLLLGLVLGAGGAGMILLPAQLGRQQEQLREHERETEMQAQLSLAAQDVLSAQEAQKKAELRCQKQGVEKNQLERRYVDAVNKVAELEQQLATKKP